MSGLENWLTGLPPELLYLFVLAWFFVESIGFPISDEPVLLLIGYLTTLGRLSLVAVIVIALVGKVAASCVAYWIGRRLDLELVKRPERQPTSGIQRWLHYARPTENMARQTEAFFARRGAWSVFLGRLVPIVRSFISYPAGAAGMPFPIFLLATTAGSLLWIAGWTALGAVVGHSYRALEGPWRTVSLWSIIALVFLVPGYWLWRRLRTRQTGLDRQRRDTLPRRLGQAGTARPAPRGGRPARTTRVASRNVRASLMEVMSPALFDPVIHIEPV
jgi:membrane protein DedA with SNARE-associated domain